MLPNEIADGETIVRAIKTPQHVRNGRLHHAAFRPAADQSKLSVMRQLIGDDKCKERAVEICGKSYLGLATLLAARIREIGPMLEDAREEFEGHAHICYDFVMIKDVPATPEQLAIFTELAKHAELHSDPAPDLPGWSGKDLSRS